MTTNKSLDIVSVEKDSTSQAVLKHISSCCEREKSLMVSVFDLNKHKFLYFNDSFKNTLGSNCSELYKNDWDFWYKKIKNDEVELIKRRINEIIYSTFPKDLPMAQYFNYHMRNIYNNWCLIHHEMSFFYYKKKPILLSYLFDVTQKERIEHFLGGKFPGSTPGLPSKIVISNREKEVLLLISEGFSSKQIADELFISNHTAISHRKNLIQKFKVKNTAQLIREASKSILV